VARNPLSAEEQSFVDGVVKASVRLAGFTGDVITEYVRLDPAAGEFDDDARRSAGTLVENIAVGWREAERAGATDPRMVADLEAGAVVDVLGAVQDSLVLALLGPEGARHMLLSADQAIARLEAIAGGNWDSGAVAQSEEADTAADPVTDLFNVTSEGAAFFSSLDDAGDVLGTEGEARARTLLARFAVCGRSVDRNRRSVDADDDDLRPSEQLLRSMVQGLVLRLSLDPTNRDLAIPISDLAVLAGLVRDALTPGS
jgi:hypothetical protein